MLKWIKKIKDEIKEYEGLPENKVETYEEEEGIINVYVDGTVSLSVEEHPLSPFIREGDMSIVGDYNLWVDFKNTKIQTRKKIALLRSYTENGVYDKFFDMSKEERDELIMKELKNLVEKRVREYNREINLKDKKQLFKESAEIKINTTIKIKNV